MLYVLQCFITCYHDYFGSNRYTQHAHAMNTEICSSRSNSIEFSYLFLGIPGILLIFLFERMPVSVLDHLRISALKSVGNVEHAALSSSCSCIRSKRNFLENHDG